VADGEEKRSETPRHEDTRGRKERGEEKKLTDPLPLLGKLRESQ
jgi:hypothetical protein